MQAPCIGGLSETLEPRSAPLDTSLPGRYCLGQRREQVTSETSLPGFCVHRRTISLSENRVVAWPCMVILTCRKSLFCISVEERLISIAWAVAHAACQQLDCIPRDRARPRGSPLLQAKPDVLDIEACRCLHSGLLKMSKQLEVASCRLPGLKSVTGTRKAPPAS